MLAPGGGPGESRLLEPLSRTHERSVRSPASNTATKEPIKGTTTNPTTGLPPAAVTSAAVNAMPAPAPAAVPR
jgi:hypothetical protein